jgi:hypothetical protein
MTTYQNAVIFFAAAPAVQRCVTTTRQNRNTSLEYVRQLRKG